MTEECIDKKLTIDEAYDAMYNYLQEYYDKTLSDDMGVLLGGMSLLANGIPIDRAAWKDWIRSVEKILKQAECAVQSNEICNAKLTIRESYDAMIDFVKEYADRIQSVDVKLLLDRMAMVKDEVSTDPVAWHDWKKSVDKILNQNPRVRPRFVLFKKE